MSWLLSPVSGDVADLLEHLDGKASPVFKLLARLPVECRVEDVVPLAVLDEFEFSGIGAVGGFADKLLVVVHVTSPSYAIRAGSPA